MFLLPFIAMADNGGVSYIGIKHKTWPCQTSLKVFDKAPEIRLGFLLDDTFGDSLQCPERLLDSPKPKHMRVHLANCTCFPERGRKCQPQELFAGLTQKEANKRIKAKDPTLLNKLRVKAAQAKAFAQKNKNGPLNFYVSPCMESGLDAQARKVMLDVAQEYFDRSVLVDNPFGSAPISNYIPELHGDGVYNKFSNFIVDNDGDPFTKIKHLPQFYKGNDRSKMTLLWDLFMNCIDPHISGFVAPRQRVCKKDTPLFDYLRELLAPDGMNPPPKKKFDKRDTQGLQFQGEGFLVKQSDTHHGMALLTRTSLSNIEITKNGKKIDSMSYSGIRENGDKIYRATKAVWELPQAMVIASKNIGFKVQYPMYRLEK